MPQTRQQIRKSKRDLQKLLNRKPGKFNLERVPSGKINSYMCPDGHVLVTRDRIKGVTPIFIGCQVCQKMATSAGYQVDQALTPAMEWDRPPIETWPMFSKEEQEHFKMGGLTLTKIES